MRLKPGNVNTSGLNAVVLQSGWLSWTRLGLAYFQLHA